MGGESVFACFSVEDESVALSIVCIWPATTICEREACALVSRRNRGKKETASVPVEWIVPVKLGIRWKQQAKQPRTAT